MLNIKKIAELVELSKETGASVKVHIHDFQDSTKEEAFVFVQELQQALNVEFVEGEAERVSWFEIDIDRCNITVFFNYKRSEVTQNAG